MLYGSKLTIQKIYFQALGSKRIIVTYEVILSIQRLIKMNGNKLSEPSWDVICDILFAISENISFYGKSIFPTDVFWERGRQNRIV